jgi:hypothetical protein
MCSYHARLLNAPVQSHVFILLRWTQHVILESVTIRSSERNCNKLLASEDHADYQESNINNCMSSCNNIDFYVTYYW